MRLFKKHTDALSSVLDGEEIKTIKSAVADDAVRGWSVFNADGIEVISEGVSETVTAVCSNAIDLASKIGAELSESEIRPSITFMKGSREMHTEALRTANMIVLRDNANGGRKEVRHGG
ncbi:MAG: hypothetical protein AAF718_02075 [Pseudomonadota bacterium]